MAEPIAHLASDFEPPPCTCAVCAFWRRSALARELGYFNAARVFREGAGKFLGGTLRLHIARTLEQEGRRRAA